MPAARGPSPLAASLEGLGQEGTRGAGDITTPGFSLGAPRSRVLEAGGLCGTDVAIARRERGGHDGVLRERGSAMKLTEPGQTRPQKSEAHHSSIFGKWLGLVETTIDGALALWSGKS